MPTYICDNPDCLHIVANAINKPDVCPACAHAGRLNSSMSKRGTKRPAPVAAPAAIPVQAAEPRRSARRRKLNPPVALNLRVTFNECPHAAQSNDENQDKYIGFTVTTRLTGPVSLGLMCDAFQLKQYIKDSYKILKPNENATAWVKALEVNTANFKLDSFGEVESLGDQDLKADSTQFNDDPGWTTPDNLIKAGFKLDFYTADLYWEVYDRGTLLHRTATKTISAAVNAQDDIVYTFPANPITWQSAQTYR